MMKKLSFILFMLLGLACKKKPIEGPSNKGDYQNGILALNEGLFEQNNASISFYSFAQKTVFSQVFKAVNNRGLGDTANDFTPFKFGGLDYIAVVIDVSSKVEFIERYTLKSVGELSLMNGVNAREPRRIIIHGNYAYVCNLDGTLAIINLIDFSVMSLLNVGQNPDAMVVVGNELFIANSGGLNYPIYDSTITVLNLSSNLIVDTFKSRINGGTMIVDAQGEIYQVSNGNYDDIPSALLRIDAGSRNVISIIEKQIFSIVKWGDWLYYYDYSKKGIFRMNMLTEVFEDLKIIDLSGYITFSGFTIDKDANLIYCFDANNYVSTSTISAYSINGNYQMSFQGGLNTNSLIFN